MSFIAGWRHVLQASGVTLAYALRFLANLARMLIVPIAPLFIQVLLPNTARVNTFTGLVVGLAAGAGTATAIYLGRLGDRIGHRRVLKASAIAAALFYLPQGLVTEAWQLLVLQALAGAATGGIIPAISALLSGFTEQGEEGSVYGIDNSIKSASRATAPLAGAAVAQWLGLRSTFALAGLLFLLVALLAVWKLPQDIVPQIPAQSEAEKQVA